MPVRPKCTCALFFFWLLLPIPAPCQVQSEVAPPSKTDTYAVADDGTKTRIQHREVANTNFRISGVDLASDEDVLIQAAKMFGKSPSKLTGDAAYSDKRTC